MLTPETLIERLANWSGSFKARQPQPSRNPIMLYQSLFALVHELKSSIHLSEDSKIKALADPVFHAEESFRALAFDYSELTAESAAALHKLALQLSSFSSFEILLRTDLASATAVTKKELTLFTLDYSWDGLSRARASSCARHRYRFFALPAQEIELSALGEYEKSLLNTLKPLNAIDVARRLETKPKGASLELSIRQLVAVPSDAAKELPKQWKPV